MTFRPHWNSKHFILAAIILGLLSLTVSPLLVRADPELPPRDAPPTDEPPPENADKDDDDDDSDDAPLGAYIELQTQPVPPGGWATVQWQDSAGGWHKVEGWHGQLGPNGYQLWWVEAKDFGKGPFRWIATSGETGPPVGTSAPFDLPAGADQRVRVTISAAQTSPE